MKTKSNLSKFRIALLFRIDYFVDIENNSNTCNHISLLMQLFKSRI